MLDRDLAELYGVKAIRLREQVKRNKERFPVNFMFQLTEDETEYMVSQNAIPSKKTSWGLFTLCFYRAYHNLCLQDIKTLFFHIFILYI